jgi:hypothetical protein
MAPKMIRRRTRSSTPFWFITEGKVILSEKKHVEKDKSHVGEY